MNRLLAICLLLTAATAAGAATPRVQALGGDGAYLEDAGNVLRWSGSLADHAGRATFGTGTFDGRGYPRDDQTLSGPWGGVQFALGGEKRPFAGALYLMSRAADLGSGSLVDLQAGGYHALICLNDAEKGAVTFSWRDARAADDPLGETRQELGVGARFDMDPSIYGDVSFDLVSFRPHDAVADTLPEEDQVSGDFAFRGRIFAGLTESLVLVVVGSADGSTQTWAADPSWPNSGYRIGTALTWLPDPDRLFLVSVDYRKFGIPHDWWSHALLFRAAIEARLNAFLSLRAAAGWEERESPDESLAPLSCGLAVHAGEWDLDLALATHPPLDPAGRRPGWGDVVLGWLSAAVSLSF